MNHQYEEKLFNRVFDNLKERRERVVSGKVNSIPFNLPRFENQVPGIEQGKYYIVTANSKVGERFAPLYGNI